MRARTIIERRDVGWRGGRYPWYVLAWVTWRVNDVGKCTDHRCMTADGPCVHGLVRERPLSKFFLRLLRLAHEAGHVLERAKNAEFHHPWHCFCGRVGHALRTNTHLPPAAMKAAMDLVDQDHTIIEEASA